jgi:hypothetical protein
MAFNQVVSGIGKIDVCFSGNIGISLTDFTASTASNIASGSYVVIDNGYFLADSDITPNASSWTAIVTATTAYLSLIASGTAGSQILTASWTPTPPVWNTTKQYWSGTTPSNIRVVASAYKNSNTSYWQKKVINYGQTYPGDIGDIQMYAGLNWIDNTTKPGWYACTTANSVYGCPALTDRFIMGALTPGSTGGNNSVTEVLTHGHSVSGTIAGSISPDGSDVAGPRVAVYNESVGSANIVNVSYTGTAANTGVAAPDNRPAYYAVIYIRKCF